jgi:hypothetical protein
MEPGLFRKVLNTSFLMTIFFLVACSPKLDWRTVQYPQERYTALFPGKPDKLERKIPYQEGELQQTLEALKVDDDIYSIATIQLPASQAIALPRLIEQLQNNLFERAKASGGNVIAEDAFYQAANRQRIPVKNYFIELQSNGKLHQIMRVCWISRTAPNGDIWIYQISVLHTNKITEDVKTFLSKEEYEYFFSNFYPE